MRTWHIGLFGLLCSLLLALSACGGGSPVNTPQQGSIGEINIELERLGATQNSRIIPIRVIFGPTGASDDIPVWIRLGYKLSLNISERVLNMSAAPGTPDFNNEALVFLIPPDGTDFILFWDAARDLGDDANEDSVVIRAGALRTDADDPEEAICDFQPVVQVILDEGVVCQSVPPQIEGETLVQAIPGQTYTDQVEATGGESPVRFELWDSVNNEPAETNTVAPGLTLDEFTGQISGTFVWTSPDAIEFVVRASDECTAPNQNESLRENQQIVGGGLRFDLAEFTIPVATTDCPEAPPEITTEAIELTFNTPADFQLTATGGTGALTWTTDGNLGIGMALTTDGRITGSIQTYSLNPIPVHATDSCVPPRTDVEDLPFVISCQDAPPVFNFPQPVPIGMYGEFYDYTFTVDFPGGFGSVLENDGNLPLGVDFEVTPAADNLSASVRVSGTPQESSDFRHGASAPQGDFFEFVFEATDACPEEPLSDLGFLTIEILPAGGCAPLSLSQQELPDGELGTPYSAQVSANGGVAPFTWSDLDGEPEETLPPGLTIDNNGLITGTPTQAGTFDAIQLTVADSCTDPEPQIASNIFQIVIIDPCPDIDITTTTLPSGQVDTPYSQQLAFSGGVPPVIWSEVQGKGSSLPPGIDLSPDGLLSGTPTFDGTFNFQVMVTDSCDIDGEPQTDTQDLSLTIAPANCDPILTKPPSLPTQVTNGVAQDFDVPVIGGVGTLTFAIEANPDNLPADLVLSTDGHLSGTPGTKPDTFTFDLVITDQCTPTPQEYRETITMEVVDPCEPIAILTTALPQATNGAAYDSTIQMDGVPPYTFSLLSGALPSGLTMDTDGRVTGTPDDTAGDFTITVRVSDSCQFGVQTISGDVTINLQDPVVCDPLDITTTSLPGANNDVPYSAQLLASGGSGTVTWMLNLSSSPLPLGLTLDASGLISGTPDDKPGTYTIQVDAMDQCPLGPQIDSQFLDIDLTTVNCAQLFINDETAPDVIIGTPYSFQFSALGGEGTITWSLDLTSDPLPNGLTLDSTGRLAGLVVDGSVPEEINLVVRATDQCILGAQSDTFSQLLNIRCVQLGPLSGTPTDAFNGDPYSFQPILDNPGVAPYNWSIDPKFGSGLPGGLSIDPLTGEISGSPDSSEGSFTFRVIVSDSCDINQSVSGDYVLQVFNCHPLGPIEGQPEALVNGRPFSFVPAVTDPGEPPLSWFINGKIPPPNGLIFSSVDGSFTGTPAEIPGTYVVPLFVSDTCKQSASTDLTFRVSADPGCPTLSIDNPSFPDATFGSGYFEGLDASGGSGNYFWRLAPGSGPLPDGMIVSEADGWALNGTPNNINQVDQTFTFTLQVIDFEECATGPIEGQRTYTITVRIGA